LRLFLALSNIAVTCNAKIQPDGLNDQLLKTLFFLQCRKSALYTLATGRMDMKLLNDFFDYWVELRMDQIPTANLLWEERIG
jgi:hypothetical protein